MMSNMDWTFYFGVLSLEDTSLEHIRSSEYYPKRDLVSDDSKMELPFPCLCGENALYLGKTSEGTIALSNFRLVVCYKDSFVNIPLGLVEMIECRDIFYLQIYCKDSRIVRCTFATNDACLEWYRRLSSALTAPKKLDQVFAFAFHAWLKESNNDSDLSESTGNYQLFDMTHPFTTGDSITYSFDREVQRMGFNIKTAWRITHINENYEFCSTYPKQHIVPKSIVDEDLKSAASFRTSRRIPSVVWRDRSNGAILARCSQPEVGWLGWRNTEDEKLIQELALACALDCDLPKENGHIANGHAVSNGDVNGHSPPARKVLILDARSYTAAVANRAKGGGCECPEYYPNCDIQFMNLANIHSVRKSFQALRTLCAGGPDQPNWLSGIETTRWLHHISGLMRSALIAVNAIDKEGMPVVVHCSDGWDRTPQIVALAELMLDPYYRTFEGFQCLVEREWLDFGHKFADRCGQGIHCEDSNERCPVFLQFLDCVHQLLIQFPTAFEYNQTFLVKLVQHTYSCLFGTFLCNSASERDQATLSRKTFSVWTLLKADTWKVKNYLYAGSPTQVLRPVCHVRSLRLWDAIFMANTAPLAESGAEDQADNTETPVLSKTRSCDDIVASLEDITTPKRTSSDPNLTTDPGLDSKFLLQKELDTVAPVDKRIDLCPDSVRFENCSSSDEMKSENSATESDVESDLNNILPIDHSSSDEVMDNEEVKNLANSESSTTLKMANGVIECNGNVHTIKSTLENGHDQDDSVNNCDTSIQNGVAHEPKSEIMDRLESSTDTLTGTDAVNRSQSTPIQLSNGIGNLAMDEELHKLQVSISTSTTDISDSNVTVNLNEKFCFNGQSLRINDLTLTLTAAANDDVRHSRSCQTERRPTSSKNSTTGSESGSSSCPDTPASEMKLCEPSFTSRTALNHLARRIDVDGLTLDMDPVQYRLHQRELEYQHRVAVLERQLKVAKIALLQYAHQANGNSKTNGDFSDFCLPESTGDAGELASLGQVSNPASDISWENIDEKDARMTLWVPDHAVTHCAGCHQEFWIVRRKHHCRNCGRVFCGVCTDFFTCIPQQQLLDPVRVCRQCFRQLQANQAPVFSDISDNLIAAAEG